MGRFRSPWLLLLLASLILVQPPAVVLAQNSPADTGPDISYNPDEPVPYDPEEFPLWARDLRRGEIIAIGAFPLSMVVVSFGYELGRFAYNGLGDGGLSSEYAPWFFSTSTEETFSNGERIGLILTSAVVSVGVAIADYLLGRRERRK